ncbi:unnamed protein product [Miscanthus lutarioriparius]|uniref:Uncharacterized protein n=1 Tax=Miscanthus lutarioriparius TaxID=422564 RepID=A0A811PU19_9POAL|nr:unnamed protein product [Miscanthus lutarioriparius]
MNLERGVVAGGEKGGDGNGNVSRKPSIGIVRLFLACMVSGGIQYGWALQLSLLSPRPTLRHCTLHAHKQWWIQKKYKEVGLKRARPTYNSIMSHT